MTREAAEARALAWGIPFSASTQTGDLEAMCAQMDQRRPRGTLEEFLAIHQMPGCSGVLWDAAGIKDCAICEAEYWCRQRFLEKFDEHLRDHGLTRSSPVSEIAEALGIHADSAQIALRKAPLAEPLKKSGLQFLVEKNGVQQVMSSAEIVSQVEKASGVSMQKPPEPPPVAPESAPAPEPPDAPAPTVAPEPSKQPKAWPKSPVAAAAAGVADLTGAKPKGQQPKALAARAHQRECERNPKVAKLTPESDPLEWHYKGKRYRVQVAQGCYVLDGKEYPTLTAIVAEVGGTKLYPQKDEEGNVIEGAPPKKAPVMSVAKAFDL